MCTLMYCVLKVMSLALAQRLQLMYSHVKSMEMGNVSDTATDMLHFLASTLKIPEQP